MVALDRLMAGEDLNDVTSGRQVNVTQPTPEDMQAFRSYVEGIRQRMVRTQQRRQRSRCSRRG